VVRPAAPDVGQIQALLMTDCCSATATCEPVKPSAFRRVMEKVPGVRRLDESIAAERGYAPPEPLRDIRITLPLDASPMLMRNKEMDVKATVNEDGRVTQVELLAPRDQKLVSSAAVAADAWRFTPARLNGQPVDGEVLLRFRFDSAPGAQAASFTTAHR
ncbi:MAG TPA: energy transducer TonB, partial [Bryobacteraceae bacterium]|nr:energy transducer TonB [Bryobacteraceae bacterium]